MQQIKNLLNYIKKDGFVHKAHAKMDDGKRHVLYLTPFMNATGLYRVLLPTIRLNQTESHAAAINEVRDWQLNQNMKDFDTALAPTLIAWADYIVFPTLIGDITKPLEVIRDINTKPHLQIAMDIDDSLHHVPPSHPQYRQHTQKMRDTLLRNMAHCHLITGTNNRLLTFYQKQLQQKHPDASTDFCALPNLMDDICYNLQAPQPIEDGATRIGITLRNYMSGPDVAPLVKAMLAVKKKYGKKVEFIMFGWDGKQGQASNVFRTLQYTYHPPVPIFEYFQKMTDLQLDFALLPLANTPFSLYKSHHKLLQYARLKVPCIVSDIETFTEIINPPATTDLLKISALVAQKKSDWYEHMCYFIDNPEKRQAMGAASYHACRTQYELKDNIGLWKECFY